MTFDHESLAILGECLRSLEQGFGHLPGFSPPRSELDRIIA